MVFRKHATLILANRKKLKGSGITIAEDLTAANAKLYNDCRKHGNFINVWTKNGTVMAKKQDGKIEKIHHTPLKNGFRTNQGPNHQHQRQPYRQENQINDYNRSPIALQSSQMDIDNVNTTFTAVPMIPTAPQRDDEYSANNFINTTTTTTTNTNTSMNARPSAVSTPKNMNSRYHEVSPSW